MQKKSRRSLALTVIKYYNGEEEKLVKMSLPYPNTTNNDIEENWSYTIKHIRVTQKFKCDIQGITVSFNPKKKVKCTVQKLDDIKEKTDEKELELHEFLCIDSPISNRNEIVHCPVSCSYAWEEISDDIRFDTV